MPRIDAATVAEHRRLRHQQIVQNAAALLLSAGPAAVTPGAVASATGLARTSVYQYFPTTEELIAGAMEEVFARAAEQVEVTVAAAGPDPRQRLEAYVGALIQVATSGHHPATLALAASLPDPCRDRLHQLHLQMRAPLTQVIADWGVTEPDQVAAFSLGVLDEATTQVTRGADPGELTRQVLRYVTAALDGLVAPASQRSGPGAGL